MGNNEENLFADGKENSFMQTYYKEQFECGCFLMFLHGKVIFLGIIEMKIGMKQALKKILLNENIKSDLSWPRNDRKRTPLNNSQSIKV